MRLNLNDAGRIVIRNITQEAFEYIEGERKKLYDPHGYFYFGKKIYDGSVYMDDCAGCTEVLQHIAKLVTDYGMQIDASMKVILNCWRMYAELSKWYAERCEKIKALSERNAAMKRIVCHGCGGCEKFIKVRDGDDLTGYCVQGATRTQLDESPLSFRFGEYGNDGVHYMGQKFYPHSGCEYLKGEEMS